MKEASVTMNVWMTSDPQDYIINEFVPKEEGGDIFYTLGVKGMKFFFCDREEVAALRLALTDITAKWDAFDEKQRVTQEVNQ